VEINRLKNFIIIKKAVYSSRGSLYLDYSPFDPLVSRLTPQAKHTIKVECDSLDNIVKRVIPNRTIKLVKIDVEGSEVEVLRGASETLQRTDYVLIEVEKRNIPQVSQLLRGYRIFKTGERVLIIPPGHFSLIKAFNRYANVFPYFIEPSSFIHVMHRVPGRIKVDHKSFPSNMLTLLGKILNRPHKLKIWDVKPEHIDLVFVSDPVVCRIDLKKYKNAVKAYWSQDCMYQSTFYTQLLSTKVQDYDIIFCAHKPYLERFKEFGVKTYWLPFAYDPDICRPMTLPEKYDVTFVGTLTENRKRFLEDKGEVSTPQNLLWSSIST
jgi:hypothetical protein